MKYLNCICILLGILFTTFKLLGIINWSWLFVILPFLFPILVVLASITFIVIMLIIVILRKDQILLY